jgi:hypothetical protein
MAEKGKSGIRARPSFGGSRKRLRLSKNPPKRPLPLLPPLSVRNGRWRCVACGAHAGAKWKNLANVPGGGLCERQSRQRGVPRNGIIPMGIARDDLASRPLSFGVHGSTVPLLDGRPKWNRQSRLPRALRHPRRTELQRHPSLSIQTRRLCFGYYDGPSCARRPTAIQHGPNDLLINFPSTVSNS